jgi:predicted TIM-barrel fold metal-dependent hydrolase
MHMFGFDFEKRPVPPSSEELANAWRPFVIEAFGAKRAMFESNFPVDKRYYSYGVMWNAFTRLAAQHSADEKRGLFVDAAREPYRLPIAV